MPRLGVGRVNSTSEGKISNQASLGRPSREKKAFNPYTAPPPGTVFDGAGLKGNGRRRVAKRRTAKNVSGSDDATQSDESTSSEEEQDPSEESDEVMPVTRNKSEKSVGTLRSKRSTRSLSASGDDDDQSAEEEEEEEQEEQEEEEGREGQEDDSEKSGSDFNDQDADDDMIDDSESAGSESDSESAVVEGTTLEQMRESMEKCVKSLAKFKERIRPFVSDSVYNTLQHVSLGSSLKEAKAMKNIAPIATTASELELVGADLDDDADEKLDEDTVEVLRQPPSLSKECKMRDYQLYGMSWLVSQHEKGIGSILADEMGLGKTLQTISFITHILHVEKQNGPFLVIVPLSVLSNWILEFRKWCPTIKVLRAHTTNADEGARLRLKMKDFSKSQVVVTTYEQVKQGVLVTAFKSIVWNSIILDEGHRLKNVASKMARMCSMLRARFKLILTGTPVQNTLSESWSLLNFLVPSIFTESASFDDAFSLGSTVVVDRDMIAKSHYLLRPFILRRLKVEVEKSLPAKLETLIYCPMTDVQKVWTKSLLIKNRDALESMVAGDKKEKGQGKKLANLLMQLRKAANHPYLFPGCETPNLDGLPTEEIVNYSGKMVMLDRLLKSLKEKGHRVAIFSQFTRVLDIIGDYLLYRGYDSSRLDGSTNRVMRQVYIQEFNSSKSKHFIFCLTTRAGGEGVNLYTADTVILFDSDWNPQVDLQAMARVHRIGQTKTVHIYRLITAESVEERVVQRAQKKLYLDSLVNRGSSAQAKALDQEIKKSKADPTGEESDEISEIFSALKFGWNSIFSSTDNRIEMSDEELAYIIDRKRGLDENGKLLNEKSVAGGADDSSRLKSTVSSVHDFNENAELLNIKMFEGKILKEVAPIISAIDLKLAKGGLKQSDVIEGRREKKSRIIQEYHEELGMIEVLKSNAYTMEEGEPSIFEREAKSAWKQEAASKKNNFFVPSTGNQRAGRDYVHQDHCQICWDGGDILCCDFCPMAFHLECLELEEPPEGRWSCPHHDCAECQRRGAQVELLFRCDQCEYAYCEDCLPKSGVHVYGESDRLSLLGYKRTSNSCYITCSVECHKHAVELGQEQDEDEDEDDESSQREKATDPGTSRPDGLDSPAARKKLEASQLQKKKEKREEEDALAYERVLESLDNCEVDMMQRIEMLKDVDAAARYQSLGSLFGFGLKWEMASRAIKTVVRQILQKISRHFGKDLVQSTESDDMLTTADSTGAEDGNDIHEKKLFAIERERKRELAADAAVFAYKGVSLNDANQKPVKNKKFNEWALKCVKSVLDAIRILTSVQKEQLVEIANLFGIVQVNNLFSSKSVKNLNALDAMRRTQVPEPKFKAMEKTKARVQIEEVVATFLVTLLPQTAFLGVGSMAPSASSASVVSSADKVVSSIHGLLKISRFLESRTFLSQEITGLSFNTAASHFTGLSFLTEKVNAELVNVKWGGKYAPCDVKQFNEIMEPARRLYAQMKRLPGFSTKLSLLPVKLIPLLENASSERQLQSLYASSGKVNWIDSGSEVEDGGDHDAGDHDSDKDYKEESSSQSDSDPESQDENGPGNNMLKQNSESAATPNPAKDATNQFRYMIFGVQVDVFPNHAHLYLPTFANLSLQAFSYMPPHALLPTSAHETATNMFAVNPLFRSPRHDVVEWSARGQYTAANSSWNAMPKGTKDKWRELFLVAWCSWSADKRVDLERAYSAYVYSLRPQVALSGSSASSSKGALWLQEVVNGAFEMFLQQMLPNLPASASQTKKDATVSSLWNMIAPAQMAVMISRCAMLQRDSAAASAGSAAADASVAQSAPGDRLVLSPPFPGPTHWRYNNLAHVTNPAIIEANYVPWTQSDVNSAFDSYFSIHSTRSPHVGRLADPSVLTQVRQAVSKAWESMDLKGCKRYVLNSIRLASGRWAGPADEDLSRFALPMPTSSNFVYFDFDWNNHRLAESLGIKRQLMPVSKKNVAKKAAPAPRPSGILKPSNFSARPAPALAPAPAPAPARAPTPTVVLAPAPAPALARVAAPTPAPAPALSKAMSGENAAPVSAKSPSVLQSKIIIRSASPGNSQSSSQDSLSQKPQVDSSAAPASSHALNQFPPAEFAKARQEVTLWLRTNILHDPRGRGNEEEGEAGLLATAQSNIVPFCTVNQILPPGGFLFLPNRFDMPTKLKVLQHAEGELVIAAAGSLAQYADMQTIRRRLMQTSSAKYLCYVPDARPADAAAAPQSSNSAVAGGGGPAGAKSVAAAAGAATASVMPAVAPPASSAGKSIAQPAQSAPSLDLGKRHPAHTLLAQQPQINEGAHAPTSPSPVFKKAKLEPTDGRSRSDPRVRMSSGDMHTLAAKSGKEVFALDSETESEAETEEMAVVEGGGGEGGVNSGIRSGGADGAGGQTAAPAEPAASDLVSEAEAEEMAEADTEEMAAVETEEMAVAEGGGGGGGGEVNSGIGSGSDDGAGVQTTVERLEAPASRAIEMANRSSSRDGGEFSDGFSTVSEENAARLEVEGSEASSDEE